MRIIDSLGKKCPQPILDLAAALKEFEEDEEFTLHSDDIATWHDLSAWSRMTGHLVTRLDQDIFHIQRRREI